MPFSYDPGLSSDRDWVRLLSGDRVADQMRLADEEIDALLREESNKYLAAARACELLLARSGGLVTKQVDTLRLQWSDNSTAETTYTKYIKYLKERGAQLTIRAPLTFKNL